LEPAKSGMSRVAWLEAACRVRGGGLAVDLLVKMSAALLTESGHAHSCTFCGKLNLPNLKCALF